MDYPFGIDISKHQYSSDGKLKPNFDTINATCAFVAVRAGISWGYTDPWFSYSWEHLTVPRLAYHVVYPGEWANKQMDHFLSIVKPEANDRLVLDLELDHGYSKARITQTVNDCLAYILSNTGRYPIIYSRAGWVNQFLEVSDLPELDWWLAQYRKRLPAPLYTPELNPPPNLPIGVNKWLIHQTGEKGNGGQVGVRSYYVDTNRFNGTQDELLAYFGLGEVVPPEPEPPVEKLFDARVYSWATPYVNIRKEPDITSEDVGNVYPNEVVGVTSITGDWYGLSNGFVMSKFLERLDFEPPASMLDIAPLSQRDPRWASDKLGNSNLTIGSHGCLVTCLAMAVGVTPAEFNRRLREVGGFTGALVYWKMVEVAYPQLDYYKFIDCRYVPAPLNEIDAMLALGIPVEVEVDFNPDTAFVDQHWILLIGKSGDDYIANDPWTGERISFRAKYGEPSRWIFRIVAYRKQS